MNRLSNIIAEFNKTLGGKFSESEPVSEAVKRMPEQVLEDQQYQNVQIELDSVLRRLVTSMVRCQAEIYKAYTEDGEYQERPDEETFRGTSVTEQLSPDVVEGKLHSEFRSNKPMARQKCGTNWVYRERPMFPANP